MLTHNEDVSNGLANGTLCLFIGAVLKPNATTLTQCLDGYYVQTVDAHDVDHIECQFEPGDDGKPGKKFKIFPHKINWTAQLDEGFSYPTTLTATATQFPILPNNATTCHKLQGASKKSLFIVSISNAKNWLYVALSRVRTLTGLYAYLARSIQFKQPHVEGSLATRHDGTIQRPSPNTLPCPGLK